MSKSTKKDYRGEIELMSITHGDGNFGGVFGYIHTMYHDLEKEICRKKKLHHIPDYSALFGHLNLRLWSMAYGKRDKMIFERDDEGIEDLRLLLNKDYAIKLINDFVDFTSNK